jgi:hypothetical protein
MSDIPIMTIRSFKKLISKLGGESLDNYQIWLSNDEEGNIFLPMLDRIDLSIGLDEKRKRIILFPSDCSYEERDF